jgi:hypothetical protein
MPNVSPAKQPTPPLARAYDPLAGLLSFLIPGLGQIYQGRIAKGVIFLLSIYGLFFYGMYLGSGTVTKDGHEYHVSGSVYLPDTADKNDPWGLKDKWRLGANLYNRPQYLGQFWAGIVAWPALWQYANDDGDRDPDKKTHPLGDFERTPSEEDLNAVHTEGDKRLELGWVYTVIAGVLNIMIIYDALAGPAFLASSGDTLREAAA